MNVFSLILKDVFLKARMQVITKFDFTKQISSKPNRGKRMRYLKLTTLALAAFTGLTGVASAADPAACETIRLSDPGWTDITSTNAIASVLLDGLGYKADVKTMSVPIGYEALKTGNTDVFLGNWMPAQQKFRDDLASTKSAEVLVRIWKAPNSLSLCQITSPRKA